LTSITARHLAAAIGYMALARGDMAGAASFGNRLQAELPPLRNASQTPRLFEFLAGLRAGGRTSLVEPLREYAGRRAPSWRRAAVAGAGVLLFLVLLLVAFALAGRIDLDVYKDGTVEGVYSYVYTCW